MEGRKAGRERGEGGRKQEDKWKTWKLNGRDDGKDRGRT